MELNDPSTELCSYRPRPTVEHHNWIHQDPQTWPDHGGGQAGQVTKGKIYFFFFTFLIPQKHKNKNKNTYCGTERKRNLWSINVLSKMLYLIVIFLSESNLCEQKIEMNPSEEKNRNGSSCNNQLPFNNISVM